MLIEPYWLTVPQKPHIQVALTFVSWCVFLYFFWKIGDPFPILSPKHGQYEHMGDMQIVCITSIHIYVTLMLLFQHTCLCIGIYTLSILSRCLFKLFLRMVCISMWSLKLQITNKKACAVLLNQVNVFAWFIQGQKNL